MKKAFTVVIGVILGMCAMAFTPQDESHPRLFLRAGEEKALLRNIQMDDVWSRMHAAILEECDLICTLPCQERKIVGPRMHASSCEILRRVLFLSYAWRTTGVEKYAARAEKEMLYTSAFEDWHPSHYLDVAEIAAALGIGYDWLYDYLSDKSRETISQALKEKALDTAESDKCRSRFLLRNNWGQVCNGGVTIAAIALWSENGAQSRRIIKRCSEDILEAMNAGYPPFGCFREGFGYWAFGTQYNILFIDAMEKFFGSEAVRQYKEIPGFIESGNYSQQLITPSLKTFGYSDNSTRIYLEPAVMWFNTVRPSPEMFFRQRALFEKFDRTHSYVKTIKNRLIPFMLIWGAGTGEKPSANMQEAVEPENNFYLGKGDNDICVMRSGWKEDDAYLGFKCGRVRNPHGHMDVGSFYYELDGVRWSLDLGSDDYGKVQTNGIKLFDMNAGSDRWTKLTKYNNFAHSTTYPLGMYQDIDADCHIQASQAGMTAESELSGLYPGTLKALRRRVILSGKDVTVEDRLTAGVRNVEMVWNMTTEALSFTRDGNTLILSAKGGKSLVMDVSCSSAFTAELVSANPRHSYEGKNPGVCFLRLGYSVSGGKDGFMKVSMHNGETTSTDHPRLILRAGEEEKLMTNIRSDKRWSDLHRRVIKAAEELLKEDLQKFQIGVRGEMHPQCCEAARQALYTAYAYRMTGDKRYLDKAEAMALNICALPSWNPYHFLDVAELTVATSFLYDWCYEGFSASTRKALVESIRDKALIPSETGGEGNPKYNLRWMDMTSNWSQICHGSLAVGAIAVHSEEPELAERIIERSIDKIATPMKAEYPPMGAYSQGIGYWGYGTALNAIFFDSMEKYFGPERTASLANIPGFMMTGSYYSQLITNALGNFSFCDNSTGEVMPEHCIFWFYAKTKDPALLYHQKILVDKYISDERLTLGSYGRHLPLMMVWGAGTGDGPAADFEKAERPEGLFYLADGLNPVCTMRSGWNQEDLWVGFKAGNPSCPHGHMDVGEFLLEYGGARFSTDLGSDRYGKIAELKLGSMFKMGEESMRWNSLLRYNNFSHSTLTVNNAFQNLETKSGFVSYSADPAEMYAVADLTPTYSEQVESLTRKVSLLNQTTVVVEDEMKAKDWIPANVTWNLTTEAEGYSFDQKTGEFTLTAKGIDGPRTMKMKVSLASGSKYKVERVPVNSEMKYPQAETPADGCWFIRIRFTIKKGMSEKLTCSFIPVED